MSDSRYIYTHRMHTHELLKLCGAVTLLSMLLTADTRPTSNTTTMTTTMTSPSDAADNVTTPICTDLCHKCLNLSTSHQWAPNATAHAQALSEAVDNSSVGQEDDIEAAQKVEGVGENENEEEGEEEEEGGSGNEEEFRFSKIGRRRRQEVTSSPCMQELLGHVTFLQEEMLRLDTRVSSMLGSLGMRTDEGILGSGSGKR